MNSEIVASFIIPIYNTAPGLLERCINSIEKIGDSNIEIILVNDGSKSEETNQKCKELCEIYANVFLYTQDNKGVSVARNNGIKNSKGKYIIFADPDDYFTNDITNIVNLLYDEQSDVVLYPCYRETNNGERTRIDLDNKSEKINIIELINNTLFCGKFYSNYYGGAIWSKAFRNRFLKSENITFDSSLRKAQDRVFMLYVYSKAVSLKYIDVPSYVYYQNFDSICNKYNTNASSRAYSFVKAVDTFLNETNMNLERKKLASMVKYISFFEVLYLDIFNFESRYSKKNQIQLAIREFEKFDLKESLNIININDIEGKSGKVKYLLIKFKMFNILRIIISKRQKKIRKL